MKLLTLADVYKPPTIGEMAAAMGTIKNLQEYRRNVEEAEENKIIEKEIAAALGQQNTNQLNRMNNIDKVNVNNLLNAEQSNEYIPALGSNKKEISLQDVSKQEIGSQEDYNQQMSLQNISHQQLVDPIYDFINKLRITQKILFQHGQASKALAIENQINNALEAIDKKKTERMKQIIEGRNNLVNMYIELYKIFGSDKAQKFMEIYLDDPNIRKQFGGIPKDIFNGLDISINNIMSKDLGNGNILVMTPSGEIFTIPDHYPSNIIQLAISKAGSNASAEDIMKLIEKFSKAQNAGNSNNTKIENTQFQKQKALLQSYENEYKRINDKYSNFSMNSNGKLTVRSQNGTEHEIKKNTDAYKNYVKDMKRLEELKAKISILRSKIGGEDLNEVINLTNYTPKGK